MNREEKAALKKSIQDKMTATKADIVAYEALIRPISPDNAIGRLTRMEAIASKSINEAALRKARETRLGLERALARVDHPDFGLCRECESPIPVARLMVLPETDLCVGCAQAMSG